LEEELLEIWNGKYCTIDEIVSFALMHNAQISRKTMIWRVNELVKRQAMREKLNILLNKPCH